MILNCKSHLLKISEINDLQLTLEQQQPLNEFQCSLGVYQEKTDQNGLFKIHSDLPQNLAINDLLPFL